jgi:hypothetical protein
VTAPDLRPLSVGEILDVAIKIYLLHAWTLFRVVLVVVVPMQILVTLVDASATEGIFSGAADAEDFTPEEELPALIGGTVVILVALVLGFVLSAAACFKAVADAYLGAEPDWRSSLAFAARRLHAVIWISTLAGLFGLLAFAALILPGIWLLVAWTVAIPVLLTEDVRGLGALRRSFRLVRGRWWGTFGVVLLGSLLVSIVSGLLTGIGSALVFVAEDTFAAFVLNAVVSILSALVTTPFYAAFVVVLYVDLRVRKEAFDLELLAERIGVAPGEDAPARRAAQPLPGPPPRTDSGEEPPFWPPPPGWKPAGGSRPPEPRSSAQPPFWPPPPGWKPGGREPGDWKLEDWKPEERKPGEDASEGR